MPRYHFPLWLIAPHIPSFLLGRRRSLAADVARAFKAIGTAPRVLEAEHIPLREPFVMVMNHYYRRDVPAWWSAMAVIHAVAERRAGLAPNELRWLIASQWTYDHPMQKTIMTPLVRFMLARVAQAYDFITITPVVLGATAASERAYSIRRVIESAERAKHAGYPIGLAPEGGDSADGSLRPPPTGTGRFMLLLASTGLPFLPVGVFMEDHVLVTRFGAPFPLSKPASLKKSEADRWASNDVMCQIAHLLPRALHGAYRDEHRPQ